MPICTTCTRPTPYLYTVYQSAHNLRLEQCVRFISRRVPDNPLTWEKNEQTVCNTFADPYVEHDALTLLLDLILLKRGVYRHLLYNRGTKPRKANAVKETADEVSVRLERERRDRERLRWLLVLRLGSILVLVDAFIRWTYLKLDRNHSLDNSITPWTRETMAAFIRTLIGCLVETFAFHSGIMLSCYIISELLDRARSRMNQTPTPMSGIRQEFRFSLIPLALLYSSMSKLFLLFLLSIWRPVPSERPQHHQHEATTSANNVSFLSMALRIMDDDRIDREWTVRNVLGGMSAGFGLRVIFDWHPGFTTMIIFVGWAIKTLVSRVVSGWVGGSEQAGEAWLAYSIP